MSQPVTERIQQREIATQQPELQTYFDSKLKGAELYS